MLCLTPLIGGWCSRGGPAILFTHFRPVTEDHERGREIYSAIVSAFGSRENDRAPSFPKPSVLPEVARPARSRSAQPGRVWLGTASPDATANVFRDRDVRNGAPDQESGVGGGKEDFEVVNETRVAE